MDDYFDVMMPQDAVKKISSLGLAHLGDAVYELMVRVWLCEHGGATSKGLHSAAVRYVSAPAQAAAVRRIEGLLTKEEADIYRRGRNAHVNSVPHNATREEYHAATGLEALFGALYLTGRRDRICELFSAVMDSDGEHD